MRTQGGGVLTIEDYIATYCEADTVKVGSQVPIKNIEILSLKVILYTMNRIVG
jgi:hypothetical protein